MDPVTCYLVGSKEPQEVPTIEEMDRLLDLTAEGSSPEFGHALVFYSDNDNSRLVVGVGRPLVPVFHDDDRPNRPESTFPSYVRSLGDITGPAGEETEVWRIDTSWDEIERSTLIPEADAREAAREWFRTHNRPSNIRWQV